MLFKQQHLEGIKAGKVSLAFRRWAKPTVKEGSVIKTSVGLVEIKGIATITANKITEANAVAAGYATREALLKELNSRPEGNIYKIAVAYYAVDPRIALREKDAFSQEDFTTLTTALERLDKYSKSGPWTKDILQAIKTNPGLRAADLAVRTGKEKDWLKLNIRKLKNLGLTISLDPGYKISPRGERFLLQLRKR